MKFTLKCSRVLQNQNLMVRILHNAHIIQTNITLLRRNK